MYACTPACTAEIWIFFFYFLKAFFILKSEWLITLLQNICFFVCKYILYPFIIQQEMLMWDETRKDVPSLQPHCIFLRIYILKMSCRKCWKWYFRDPKFEHLLGEYTPETPLVWSTFCALTFLPLQRPSKSHTLLMKYYPYLAGKYPSCPFVNLLDLPLWYTGNTFHRRSIQGCL